MNTQLGYGDAIRLQYDFYLSNILWHFIKHRPEDDRVAIDLLFDEFLSIKGELTFLRGGKSRTLEFERKIQMTASGVSKSHDVWGDSAWGDGSWCRLDKDVLPPKHDYTAVESTAICFADIPIHCVGAHSHRYGNSGVAIGISKLNYEMLIGYEIMPVQYVPKLTFDNMARFGTLDDKEKRFKLREFVKIPTLAESDLPGETFDEIYAEREWRTYRTELKIEPSQIEAVILPTRGEISRLSKQRQETLGCLIAEGCSVLALDSLLRNPARSSR